MARCASCRRLILFGGVQQGARRYCNEQCALTASLESVELSEGEIEDALMRLHLGACPSCGGQGPIDAHASYRVISVVLVTQYATHVNVGCARCGRKVIAKNLAITFLAGWWGFPSGLLLTPIYLVMGTVSLFKAGARTPSARLRSVVATQLARERLSEGRSASDLTPPPALEIPYTGPRPR